MASNRASGTPGGGSVRRRSLRTVLIVVLALGLLGGGYAVARLTGGGKPQGTSADKSVTTGTAAVQEGALSSQQSLTGTVGYVGTYGVVDQLQGVFTALPTTGQVVRQGQVLYGVGTGASATQAAIDAAQAQLQSDEASLAALESPTPPTAAQLQADRQRIAADRQTIADAPKTIANQQQKIALDQQRIKTDEAQVAQDQESISELTATSPVAGVISSVDFSAGQVAQQGQTLFEVVQPSDIEVATTVPEIDLSQIYVGEGVEVWTESQGTLSAVVSAIGISASGSDRQGATFPVTLKVENPPEGMLAGETATANFTQNYLSEPGTVAYADPVDVKAAVSGTVASVALQVGQSVTAGQAVLTMSSAQLQSQLTSDESQVAQDQGQLSSDEVQLSTLRAQLTSEQAALSSDQATLQALESPAPARPDQISSLKSRIAADEAGLAEGRANLTDVLLLYGSTPAYRALEQGEQGQDVLELNRDLVALGYSAGGALKPTSDVFGPATAAALKALQTHLGQAATGSIPLGGVVFEPTAVRVTTVGPNVGGAATPGQTVLSATSDTPEVVAPIDATLQSDVKVGEPVAITLPDGSETDGAVLSETEGTDSSGNTLILVNIAPKHPGELSLLNGASVNVSVTTASVASALAVPVTALLAKPGGGYEVEVVAGSRRSYVPVQIGLFDDQAGLVQVRGDLRAGEEVVVAGS